MLEQLEQAIGYTFKNKALLETALSHSSYANETLHDSLKSYERLEFLGDSILGCVVAQYLYLNFPDKPEGQLTRLRAELVCEANLAKIATKLSIGEHLKLGHGGEQDGGRYRTSIIADVVESIIAASFLDGGEDAARGIINRFVLSEVSFDSIHDDDYKTALQELVQRKKNQTISYRLIGENGPDHQKTFCVEVLLNGETIGTGEGTSKKRAEQDAAHHGIAYLTAHK